MQSMVAIGQNGFNVDSLVEALNKVEASSRIRLHREGDELKLVILFGFEPSEEGTGQLLKIYTGLKTTAPVLVISGEKKGYRGRNLEQAALLQSKIPCFYLLNPQPEQILRSAYLLWRFGFHKGSIWPVYQVCGGGGCKRTYACKRSGKLVFFESSRFLLTNAEDQQGSSFNMNLRGGQFGEPGILLGEKLSTCVSCMAGCPVGCSFCATSKIPNAVYLNAAEIAEQVIGFEDGRLQWYDGFIRHVSFEGEGDICLNVEEIFGAIALLCDFYNMQVAFSFSTVGILEGLHKIIGQIRALKPKVCIHPQLTVNCVSQEWRSKYMRDAGPIAETFPLMVEIADLLDQQLVLNITMSQHTDTCENALATITFLRHHQQPRRGYRIKVSTLNGMIGGFRPSIDGVFSEVMAAAGYQIQHVRSIGPDQGQCGRMVTQILKV